MNTEDRIFLEALGLVLGASPGTGDSPRAWRILSRGGRVLLLLSDKEADFRSGLSLYLPLRKLARIVAGSLKKIPGARRFLPRVVLEVSATGVLGRIVDEMGGAPVSILLGNPCQAERRALLLCRQEDGSLQVAKVGVSKKAREKISQEASVLRSLQENLPESSLFPSLLRIWQEDQWDGFALPFYRQREAIDWSISEVIGILKSWLTGKKALPVQECVSWEKIRVHLSESEKKEAGSLALVRSLRHGDFAPWNILNIGARDPVVIDWEFGQLDDLPGWDLIHYFLMTSHLIDQNTVEETITKVENTMVNEVEVRGYLKAVGWAGHEDLLLKSYLLMMGEQLPGFLKSMESRTVPSNANLS